MRKIIALAFLALAFQGLSAQEINLKVDNYGELTPESIELAMKNQEAEFSAIYPDGTVERLHSLKCGPQGCTATGNGLCGFISISNRGIRSWSFRNCRNAN
jgi:hypothetical protein